MRLCVIAAVLAASLAIPALGHAQASNPQVVSSCGSASYSAGIPAPPTQDTTGAACTNTSGGGSPSHVIVDSGTITTVTDPVGVKGVDGAAISSNANPFPIKLGSAASTNGSSTVTLGNTFQTALASSATRKGCLLQNPTTATEVLYVNFGVLGSATTANSFSVAPGAAITCAGPAITASDAVNVTAATTSHAFVLVSQ